MDVVAPTLLEQLPVLSDPIRARLLSLLDKQELMVSEACDILQLPQSTVSRHLKTLADAAWVTSRREGTSRFYALADDELPPGTRTLWRLVRDEVHGSMAASEDERRLKSVLARRRSRSEEFFSSAAGQWDRVRDELFGALNPFRALLAWLDDGWTVGDLGCGTGQVGEAVAPFVARVVAVDASPDMMDAARGRLRDHRNVEFRRGALERLPLEDGSLDAACVVLVLHHVPDPAKVLAEAARVLHPGGRLLVVDMLPHERDEYRRSMGHVWLGFSERQILRLCEAAGFEGIRWHALPTDTRAKGPGLFVAAARRAARGPVRTAMPADAGDAGGRAARTGGDSVRGPRATAPARTGRTGPHGPLSKEHEA
jgi:ArsR family transcriptional regulator